MPRILVFGIYAGDRLTLKTSTAAFFNPRPMKWNRMFDWVLGLFSSFFKPRVMRRLLPLPIDF